MKVIELTNKKEKKGFSLGFHRIQVQLDPMPTSQKIWRMHLQAGEPGTKEDGSYVSRSILITKKLAMIILQTDAEQRISFRGQSLSTYLDITDTVKDESTDLNEEFKKEHDMSILGMVYQTWEHGDQGQPHHSLPMHKEALLEISKLFEPNFYAAVLDSMDINDDTTEH